MSKVVWTAERAVARTDLTSIRGTVGYNVTLVCGHQFFRATKRPPRLNKRIACTPCTILLRKSKEAPND